MELVLVCPGCRTRTADRLDLRTLEPRGRGDVLACACGRRYPVVDGVPIVMADPSAYLRAEAATVTTIGGPCSAHTTRRPRKRRW